jgi:hypothetical protein
MDCQSLVALPWEEAEALLQESGVPYEREITRPVRDFFKTDEKRLYVLRVQERGQGIKVTLGAKVIPSVQGHQDKEV